MNALQLSEKNSSYINTYTSIYTAFGEQLNEDQEKLECYAGIGL